MTPPRMKGKKGYFAERLLIKPAFFSSFFIFFSLGGNPKSFLLLASPIFSKKRALNPKINQMSTEPQLYKNSDLSCITSAIHNVNNGLSWKRIQVNTDC